MPSLSPNQETLVLTKRDNSHILERFDSQLLAKQDYQLSPSKKLSFGHAKPKQEVNDENAIYIYNLRHEKRGKNIVIILDIFKLTKDGKKELVASKESIQEEKEEKSNLKSSFKLTPQKKKTHDVAEIKRLQEDALKKKKIAEEKSTELKQQERIALNQHQIILQQAVQTKKAAEKQSIKQADILKKLNDNKQQTEKTISDQKLLQKKLTEKSLQEKMHSLALKTSQHQQQTKTSLASTMVAFFNARSSLSSETAKPTHQSTFPLSKDKENNSKLNNKSSKTSSIDFFISQNKKHYTDKELEKKMQEPGNVIKFFAEKLITKISGNNLGSSNKTLSAKMCR